MTWQTFFYCNKVDFKNKNLPEFNNFVLTQEIVLLTGNIFNFFFLFFT